MGTFLFRISTSTRGDQFDNSLLSDIVFPYIVESLRKVLLWLNSTDIYPIAEIEKTLADILLPNPIFSSIRRPDDIEGDIAIESLEHVRGNGLWRAFKQSPPKDSPDRCVEALPINYASSRIDSLHDSSIDEHVDFGSTGLDPLSSPHQPRYNDLRER